MKKFFYINNEGQQTGPCSMDELRQAAVTRETMVWHDGMADWAKAGGVEELRPLFEYTPPQVHQAQPVRPVAPGYSQVQPDTKPDSWMVWAILTTALCCLPLGIAAILQAAKVDRLWAEGNYNEAVKAASDAKKYSLIGIIGGGVFVIVYVLMVVVFGVMGSIF